MQKQTITFLITLLLSLSFSVVAGSVVADSREDKIAQLIEAQGFEDILNAQMAVHRSESERVGQEMLQSFLDNIDATDEIKSDHDSAYKKYLNAVVKPWTAKEVTQVWSKLYGVHFTDKELDGLLAFYTSELAQRETEVIKTAVPEYTRHFQDLAKQIFKNAVETYRFELLLIAERCACQKDA